MLKVHIYLLLTVGFVFLRAAQKIDPRDAACYSHGLHCFPQWFLDHLGLDPAMNLNKTTDQLTEQLLSEHHLEKFGDTPPDCSSQKEVLQCVSVVVTDFCTVKNIYRSKVESYLQFYRQLCAHVNCLVFATTCLNGFEALEDRCESNPTKCVLNTLQFEHVETGQTSEKRVAVVRTTAHSGICRQHSSLICQVLADPPEITHLNEADLKNIADMISPKEKLASNQTPRFLTTADGYKSLPNILTGSKGCLSRSMELCSPVSSEIVNEMKTVLNSEHLACQRQECFAYLSSITTGTCSLLHLDHMYDSLDEDSLSPEEICLAVPQMVHCALHTPNICLSLLEALLEGFGMKILLMTEVKEIIQNPSNRRFADVYFKVFFSTDSCTGCLKGILSCLPDFTVRDPFKVCGHLDSVQSCVVHNVPMCSELFPPSFSPALQNALPDLIRFGKWLCGVVNSDATSCYIRSLGCLGVTPANHSHVADGFGALLNLFMSLEAGKINEAFSQLCVDMSERSPCLDEVYRTCEEQSKDTDLRQQFLILDQVMAFICWLLNGDYSFNSLGPLSIFSEIDLIEVWRELNDFIYDNAGLESYSVHLQLTFDAEWQGVYSNMSYTDTAMLKENVEFALKQILVGRKDFMNPIVQFFLEGSIVADFLLVNLEQMNPYNKADLVEYLASNISAMGFQIPIAGTQYVVTELTVVKESKKETSLVSVLHTGEPCLLYRVYSVCEHGICLPEGNSPACRCEQHYEGKFCTERIADSSENSSIPNLVLWLVLLTLLIAVPVILVTVICLKYRGVQTKRNKSKREADKEEIMSLEQSQIGDSMIGSPMHTGQVYQPQARENMILTPMNNDQVYQQVLYIHCSENISHSH